VLGVREAALGRAKQGGPVVEPRGREPMPHGAIVLRERRVRRLADDRLP
jgi:hypothetical protein